MSLAINYEQLKRDIGRYLGYDREPGNWTEDEDEDVEQVIAQGLRQFYRPPRIPGDKYSHQWSFLRPIGSLAITSGTADYDLPTDFADLDGDLYFVTGDNCPTRIRQVNEGRILDLRSRETSMDTISSPSECAVVAKKSDGTAEQVYTLMLWPTPDADYTVKFRYYSRQQMLTADADVPLGGTEHAETIRASCLAAAESFLDDERGAKWAEFLDQLQASVDFDRKANSPSTLGYNGDRSDKRSMSDDVFHIAPNITVYEKYPL